MVEVRDCAMILALILTLAVLSFVRGTQLIMQWATAKRIEKEKHGRR